MHTVHRCGLLLHSMACVCLLVNVLVTWVSPAKTAEPIEMSFGVLTQVGARNHILDGNQNMMKPLAAASADITAMWPFTKLLQILVINIIIKPSDM